MKRKLFCCIILFSITAKQVVKTLRDGIETYGNHNIRWDGKDESGKKVVPGVYFYKLDSGKGFITKRFIIVK